MIDLQFIRSFFPPEMAGESRYHRYMLKEYLQLLILDYLTTTPQIGKLAFIGGTNLRLIQGIDRFSEDLDFDCKGMSEEEFMEMTDGVVAYLKKNNIDVVTRDSPNPHLTAFRRNLLFPEMLFSLGLTGHREQRLLLKIEAQDQCVDYAPAVATVNRMGFFFDLRVPPLDVLCAMKFAAVLSRQKGRDFYDIVFLLSKTGPNMDFLRARTGISSLEELKTAFFALLEKIDLNQKKRDFSHLLFNESNADRILQFKTQFCSCCHIS
ncbi:MAG: nucleotidyl transferase AbiEii/AbiGii toxin family protein [Bacteroidales bacterium]|nr:nucleotidyl transferase AbiEii/AbiGii toxin family protein [Bacteroidales bacterium]